MATYLELKGQLATLDLKIEVALAAEKAKAIREIQAQMAECLIDPRDLQGHTRANPSISAASRRNGKAVPAVHKET